jgi:anti-sigma factor RsiW
MTCCESREYLFAFLDDELDAPLSIELQRHLERCHDCAREVEIERTTRRHLAAVLAVPGQAEPFEEDRLRYVLERDESHGLGRQVPVPRFRWLPRRAAGVAGIAAAVLVCATAWMLLRPGAATNVSRSFADLAVADFEHFLEEGQHVQFASDRPAAVADWLLGQTGLAVVLPPMERPGCKLVGGRKCKIAGRPAAFAVYELDGLPASLLVVEGQGFDIERMERVEEQGRTHWVERRQGRTVVACRRGKFLYAAVSALPEKELSHLMPGREHESD